MFFLDCIYNINIIKKNNLIILFLLFTNISISQTTDLFDSLYIEGVDKASKDIYIAKENLRKLEEIINLSNVQIAKLNYLKLKINKYSKSKKNTHINFHEINVKNNLNTDSLLFKGIELIHNSYTDVGIIFLFEYLNRTKDSLSLINEKYLCNINIAEGYRKKREFKKGINILNTIIFRKDISEKNLAFAYSRLSAIYNEWKSSEINGRIDSVIKYSKLSIKISRENSFIPNLASSLNEFAYVNSNVLYKYDIAEKYFKEAYDYFIEEKSYKNAINTSINLSGLYLRKREYKKALEVAEKASSICEVKGNEDAFMRLYLQLANVYSYNKMYYEAYSFLSVGRQFQISLNYNTIDRTINEFAAKYDLKIKESQIQKEKEKLIIERKQRLYIYAIFSFVIIILIISYILIVLKNKNILQQKKLAEIEKEHLKEISELKNKDLLHAIAKKISYEKILLQIKDALKNKDKHEIVNIVNQNINTENSWDNFMVKFTELNPNFFAKLANQFPNLTKSEKKLCALLFMKFKSKDIANVLNINEDSVSKSRQRLRKKLELQKTTDLSVYIHNTLK